MLRQRTSLNREWRFIKGDPSGAHSPDFDDSAWEPIHLPHCFDIPYFRTPEFYVGYGWYRKHLHISAEVGRPRRVFLEFDGVFQEAEVFLNGARVAEHQGGYTGFCLDITDHVRLGARNLLAVRVNNNWNPRLAPRAGEHIFSGGIYRDVHLVITNAVHIAWCGTRITTPQISRDSSSVKIKTEVQNDGDQIQVCSVKTQIVDPRNRLVTQIESFDYVHPGQVKSFDQTTHSILNPALWHPEHPHLYTVRTLIYDSNRVLDERVSSFGFRWLEWTPDRGFFLNGEHLYLRGANVHQDRAGWGIASTRAGCFRDVKLIKEAGFNFIRGAHYPHHPAFADACDRLGMLFWSENCFWGKGGFGPEGYWNASAYPVNAEDFELFEQSCREQLREMITINRNHPSIIAWSMTNEAFFTYNLDRARTLMKDLVNLSHELDPTRPAAIGGAQRGDVDKLGDIAGYNGDGARLFINPGVPNMVSEYGAISKPHDAYDPFYGDLVGATPASRALCAHNDRDAGVAPTEPPWRSGQAIWCGFDYGSIAGRQGLKGILDHARLPKRSWHCYREHLRGIDSPPPPLAGFADHLRLTCDNAKIHGTDGTDDALVIVTVHDPSGNRISNSPPVTLTIESGPGEFPTGRSITFDADSDIKIIDGAAAIEFRSYHGGRTLIRATSPALADATIEIETIGEPAFIPGETPLAPERRYVPPKLSEAAKAAMQNIVNVALNRPTRASSEAELHPARFANDGSAETFWSASSDDLKPWWQVDLEGFYQFSSGKIIFREESNWRYRIEISQDARTWTAAADRSDATTIATLRNDIYPPGAVARYVRFTFMSYPDVSEIEVYGILSTR